MFNEIDISVEVLNLELAVSLSQTFLKAHIAAQDCSAMRTFTLAIPCNLP
jgi:hypothetical protein